jgi:hypothetical protein
MLSLLVSLAYPNSLRLAAFTHISTGAAATAFFIFLVQVYLAGGKSDDTGKDQTYHNIG